jgi:hypothetical protein
MTIVSWASHHSPRREQAAAATREAILHRHAQSAVTLRIPRPGFRFAGWQ